MVQKKVKTILWSKSAEKQYYEILEYLSEEAPQAIEIVGNAILDMIGNLSKEYLLHPTDRLKKDKARTDYPTHSLSPNPRERGGYPDQRDYLEITKRLLTLCILLFLRHSW